MLIYILLIIFLFVLHFFLKVKNNKIIYFILTIPVSIFLCFTYMNGSDWRQYEFIYDNVNNIQSYNPYIHLEYGFFLLQYFVKKILGLNFWSFFISIKCLFFFIYCKSIYFFLSKNYFFGLVLFVSFFGLYLLIDAPFRNMIAIGFFMLSIPDLLDKRFYKYFVYVILGMLFHSSMIILLFLPLLIYKDYSTKVIVIVFLFINILFGFGFGIFTNILTVFLSNFSFFDLKLSNNFSENNLDTVKSIFSIGYIVRLSLFIIILKNKEKIISIYGIAIFNLIVLFFYTYVMALSFDILFRVNLFFSIFFIIGINAIIQVCKQKFLPGLYLFLCAFMLFTVILFVTGSNKYVPYSNYLEFLGEEKPSFYFRSNYNPNESPYD